MGEFTQDGAVEGADDGGGGGWREDHCFVEGGGRGGGCKVDFEGTRARGGGVLAGCRLNFLPSGEIIHLSFLTNKDL